MITEAVPIHSGSNEKLRSLLISRRVSPSRRIRSIVDPEVVGQRVHRAKRVDLCDGTFVHGQSLNGRRGIWRVREREGEVSSRESCVETIERERERTFRQRQNHEQNSHTIPGRSSHDSEVIKEREAVSHEATEKMNTQTTNSTTHAYRSISPKHSVTISLHF